MNVAGKYGDQYYLVENRLKLTVNETKSDVARPSMRKFLGCCVTGTLKNHLLYTQYCFLKESVYRS
jgi:hypothetical protein